ncbi:hypothetical protein BC941DRAFT_450024 [Chlamydoabsidia padenii]|nr:hypothetical protein BC941DRAFT_450024 [Chlamydoabsidia padenii]
MQVPLVTNFLGFLMQCIIYEPKMYPGYPLTLANSVLRSLGGFLVALIFLNDPVITEIFTGWNNLVMGIDCEELTRTISTDDDHRLPVYNNKEKTRRIPMRRLKIPNETVNWCLENRLLMSNVLVRRTFSKHIMVEEPTNGYFIVVDEKSDVTSYLFIYYPSANFAKFIHFLFKNPIGRALQRNSNVVVDVNISVEPMQECQYQHHHSTSASDPTAEL